MSLNEQIQFLEENNSILEELKNSGRIQLLEENNLLFVIFS